MSLTIGILVSILASQWAPVAGQTESAAGTGSGSSVQVLTSEKESFSCSGRPAGFYADIASDCQIYHTCDEAGRLFSHTCPERTRFQQKTMVCDHWYMVDCSDLKTESTVQTQTSSSVVSLQGHSDGRKSHRHSQRVIAKFPYQRVTEAPSTRTSKFPEVTKEKFRISVISDDISKEISSPFASTSPMPPSSVELPSPPSRQQQPPLLVAPSSSSSSSSFLPSSLPPTSQVLRQSSQRTLSPPSPYTLPPEIYTSSSRRSKEQPTENVFLVKNTSSTANIYSQFQTTFNDTIFTNPGGVSRIKYVTPYRQATIERVLVTPKPTVSQNTPSSTLNKYTNNPYFESYFKTSFTISSPTSPKSVETTNHTVISDGEDEIVENKLEIVIPDPRKMFYIPDSNYDPGDLNEGQSRVLIIELPVKTSMKFQKVPVTEARNHDCPQCHPSFLFPGLCRPCVLIR